LSTVLVTGAGGFIARHVAATLSRENLRVVGVARSSRSLDGFAKIYRASLLEPLTDVFEGEKIDAIVHCANHTGDDEYDTNVRGTTSWLEEANRNGVTLQIFLSSVSAAVDAPSDYGRAKYELEKRFISAGGIVFRLGVVIGAGGMFGRIVESLRRSPLVPLLDGGSSNVYIIGIDSLCRVIRDSVVPAGKDLRGRVWHLHQREAYTLRDVMHGIRRHFGYSCRFVPVPSLPALWSVSILERVPFLKLPVSSTNIRGLRQNRSLSLPSDFDHFGYSEQSLDELISNVAGARQ
jgi:nucleoside-diphosphate-sugar epimerase